MRFVSRTMVIVLLAQLGAAHAATPRDWALSSAEQLARGTFRGTMLDSDGRITLAPVERQLWGPAEGIVWDVDLGQDGNAWVALSSPGRLVRVAADGDAQTWHRVEDEGLVAAVAHDGRGGAWFGVSPEGRVYHADARGQAESHVLTGALFVWAIEPALEAGSIWVATGMPGLLLLVDKDGGVRTMFDSGDDPVRSIAVMRDGSAVVGTGGRGRVVRVDPTGRAFVLLDADETEVVALAQGQDDALYALTARGSRGVSAPQAPRGGSETVRVVASAPSGDNGDEDDSEEDSDDRGNDRSNAKRTPQRLKSPPGASLYRIAPDGAVQRIWQAGQEVPFALARHGDAMLVGTGDKGRIFRVDRRGVASVLGDMASDQVSAMAVGDDGTVLVGATGDARLVRLDAGRRAAGEWKSPVVDAGTTARWGRLSVHAELPRGTRVQVEARAGNTSDPDATWTEWIPVDELSAVPRLPATRWMQARAQLAVGRGSEAPRVRALELRYLPRNRPPRITDLRVQPGGVVWTPGPSPSSTPRGPVLADDPVARRIAASLKRKGPAPVRKYYEQGARTVTWRAEDPDDDRVVFDVEIRRDGTSNWIPLAREIAGGFHAWDARGLPDGEWRVRLVASDAPDNTAESHYRIERVSELFRVDNTRPTVGEPEIRRDDDRVVVDFVATDLGGSVASVEIAVDAGDWHPLEPVDGLADSPEERYRTRIEPEGESAPTTVRVRVTDGSGNLGGDAWPID